MIRALYDRFVDMTINYTRRIQNDSTLYSRNRGTELYAKIDEEHRSLTIKCPRQGLKPSITLSYKRVPQDFCYSANLTVANLWLPVAPEWVDDIELTIGYLSGEGKEYASHLKFTVFTSYQPTPGPDGETIFECIVGSAEAELLSDQPYTLKLFNNNEKTKKPWTVQEVLEKCADEAGLKLTARLTDDIVDEKTKQVISVGQRNTPFSTQDIPLVSFKSTYQLINWLQQQLNDKFSPEFKILTAIFNDEVFFMALDKEGHLVPLIEEKEDGSRVSRNVDLVSSSAIPVLDLIENAEWNAGVLTVVAPFVPNVTPGKAFKINPSFYKASMGLPNTVARANSQRSPTDLYSVITQNVLFSTDGENRMTLTAVPIKDAALNNGKSQETKKNFEELAKAIQAAANPAKPIEFNSGNPEEQKAIEDAKSFADLYIATKTLTSSYYKIGEPQHATIDAGGISSIIASMDLPNLKGKKSHGAKASESVSASIAWTPIILLLTHSHSQELKAQNSKDADSFKISISAPDSIARDRFLVIPEGDWQKILLSPYKTTIIQAYQICYEYYKSKADTQSYAIQMLKAKAILQAGELDEQC